MVLDRLSAPVVLAPLGGGPSTPELAAAVTEAGGLGFIAAAYLPASEVAARIESARGLTQGPLGVNVFVPGSGPAQPADYASYVERFRAWAQDAGAEVGEARWDDDDWDAKVELLTANPVEVTSFTFGCPSRELVDELHRAGSEAWVTVTSPDEATQAAAVGADVLVVQGAEAGGHRGSFVNSAELPLYGVLALLDLLRSSVSLPLVASGGIATGAALAAALCAGAVAAQIGTAFMLAPEAGTSAPHREALLTGEPTVLTRAFTGRLARGIRNDFIEQHDAGAPVAYPELNNLTSPMRKTARQEGDASRINLWAGETHQLARERPAAETVRALADEARAAVDAARDRLGAN